MKKFFSGLLVTILIAIIVGGLGYIGYSYLYMGGFGNMNMANNTIPNQTNTQGNNPSDNSMNMQNDSMNMQGGSMDMGSMNMGSMDMSQQNTMQQVNYALKNKENVNKAITLLGDIIKVATTEPNSPNNIVNNENNQQPNNVPETANDQESTTVNIYPPNVQSGNGTLNNSMANMGISYDPVKMEKFHTGLYKVSTGIEILKEIDEDLMRQAEQVGSDVKNQADYYTNQYKLTLESKNKLNKALYEINEASNLLNINPYVSSNGLVYDKDRMQELHGSILKLSQSMAALNKLSDDMTKQAITFINTAQTSANASQMDMGSMQMNTPGIFGNINISNIINIIILIFGAVFIIGLFGFISSLFKPSVPQAGKN